MQHVSVHPADTTRCDALQRYVDRLLVQLDARALALADEDGMLIAGSAHAGDLEALAAVGATHAAGRLSRTELLGLAAGGARIRSATIALDETYVIVSWVGGAALPVTEVERALAALLLPT